MIGRVGLFIIFIKIIVVSSQPSAVDAIHLHSQGFSKSVAKRAQEPRITGETEGGIVDEKSANHGSIEESRINAKETTPVLKPNETRVPEHNPVAVQPLPKPKDPSAPIAMITNATTTKGQPAVTPTDGKIRDTPKNATEPDPLEMNSPAAVKRALIVFGGFLILAIAYWVTIGRKSKTSETNNNHNINDSNQFRYGVLQSERGDDNLELSRIPLTMQSDDDDDDDLEIFDLGQKKNNKSLSYVNLQTNDEDDLSLTHDLDHFDNIQNKSNLIDIGDGDTLVNLQSDHSSKFVL